MILALLLLSVQQASCDTCAKAVRLVKSVRCHQCMANEAACESCEKHVKTIEKAVSCGDDCKKLAAEKCVPCAVQKRLVALIWCRDTCKDSAKACEQCAELRVAVLNTICVSCAPKRTVTVKGFRVTVEPGGSNARGWRQFTVTGAPHQDDKDRQVYGKIGLLDAQLQPVGGGTVSLKLPPSGATGTVNAKHLKDGKPMDWAFYRVSINVVGKPLEK